MDNETRGAELLNTITAERHNTKGGNLMKRNLHYMQKTLKELIEMYAYENGRENQKDAEITQRIIVNEVYERINKVFRMLDNNENVNIESLYAELIQAAENPKR